MVLNIIFSIDYTSIIYVFSVSHSTNSPINQMNHFTLYSLTKTNLLFSLYKIHNYSIMNTIYVKIYKNNCFNECNYVMELLMSFNYF